MFGHLLLPATARVRVLLLYHHRQLPSLQVHQAVARSPRHYKIVTANFFKNHQHQPIVMLHQGGNTLLRQHLLYALKIFSLYLKEKVGATCLSSKGYLECLLKK